MAGLLIPKESTGGSLLDYVGQVDRSSESIKVDAEIFDLETRLREKDDAAARERLKHLLKRREELLANLEQRARKRVV